MFNFPALMVGPSGFTYPYEIPNSCTFDATGLSRMRILDMPASDRTRVTLSWWMKQSEWAAETNPISGWYSSSNWMNIRFMSTGALGFQQYYGGSNNGVWTSDELFKDCSGWYHFIMKYNSNEAAVGDRVKFWCNNVQLGAGTWADYVGSTVPCQLNGGGGTRYTTIGRSERYQAFYYDGYLANIDYVDGSIESVSAFGEYNEGMWVPKEYAGAYGAGGFKLMFQDSASLGDDTSGVGNDLTPTNMAAADQVIDSPTNNHCTLDKNNSYFNTTTWSEGALKAGTTGSSYLWHGGSFVMKSGKWYWEYDIGADQAYTGTGILANGETSGDFQLAAGGPGFAGGSYTILSGFNPTRQYLNAATNVNSTNLALIAANAIIQVCFDADANKLWFGVDDVWSERGEGTPDPAAGTNPFFDSADGIDANLIDYIPSTIVYEHATGMLNFGQRAFAYTPPTGFKSLCAANIPEPLVVTPNKGMDVVLYTGDAAASNAITDLLFQPDFVWIKNRSVAASHVHYDSLRGATKRLSFEHDAAESDIADNDCVQSFDANGFTVGYTDDNSVNSAHNFAAWCLKKGAKYGFDMQTYVGTGVAKTEAHNLGGVPEMMFIKNLDDTDAWRTYHHGALNKVDPETDYGLISAATIWLDASTVWNDTAPTSSVFSIGTSLTVNADTENFIAYLFRSIPGFSKVFSFEGNGNLQGPYVNCGFRPRWILIKNADSGSFSWSIFDSERNPYNPGSQNSALFADLSNAEALNGTTDFLSNGFKLRTTGGSLNANNNTLIGIAFAEASSGNNPA